MIKIFNNHKKETVISIIKFQKFIHENGETYFTAEYVPECSYSTANCYFSNLRQYNYIEINNKRFNYRKMLRHYEKLQALIEQEENLKVINNL